ncbi:MAG: chorismate synthase [Hyphomicrobiales bacterium]
MAGNTFGRILTLTSFGESHGVAIGGVIDGFPSNVKIDMAFIQQQLDRRKPGQSSITTSRKEDDTLEILSGVFDGYSTGTPIAFMIRNKDHKSHDYSHIKDVYRPSHADYVYEKKYGIRDYRGGGRSSARETIARVVAGAFAMLWLKNFDIDIYAYVSGVGDVYLDEEITKVDKNKIDSNIVRCPDKETAKEMIALIKNVQREKNTLGGKISCVVEGLPVGIGTPVFNKLHADLGSAMLSINAVKGFEYGMGFSGCESFGADVNDKWFFDDGTIKTKTNYSGGIQGGISNGNDIVMHVAFKPVATLMQDQDSIDKHGNEIVIEGKGRHDVCVVPRAVPIVESMAALVIADHLLEYFAYKNSRF